MSKVKSKSKRANKVKARNTNGGKYQTSCDSFQFFKCTNPFTGVVSILTKIQADALKKIKELEYQINVVHTDYSGSNLERCQQIEQFDELRFEFAEKWSKIYMQQLD
tara:strand:+ start:401 stop:721 length:321 start_codon:yes stop_codon:yes gene_type:complete